MIEQKVSEKLREDAMRLKEGRKLEIDRMKKEDKDVA